MPSKEAQKRDSRTPHQKSAKRPDIRLLRVADLFGTDRELILEHNGQAYRLRITANDKLILTK